MQMTREQLSLRGQMGAYRMHSLHDARETTKPARIAFNRRFYVEVDPNGQLAQSDPAELERRVECARQAYFKGLALKSSLARAGRSKKRSRAA